MCTLSLPESLPRSSAWSKPAHSSSAVSPESGTSGAASASWRLLYVTCQPECTAPSATPARAVTELGTNPAVRALPMLSRSLKALYASPPPPTALPTIAPSFPATILVLLEPTASTSVNFVRVATARHFGTLLSPPRIFPRSPHQPLLQEALSKDTSNCEYQCIHLFHSSSRSCEIPVQ
jgi:hypothetical protein